MTEFKPRTSGIGSDALPTEPRPLPDANLIKDLKSSIVYGQYDTNGVI